MASKYASSPSLLHPYTGPQGSVDFSVAQKADYVPAIKEGIENAKAKVEAMIAQSGEPNFANTILALEQASEELEAAQTIFHTLMGTEADEDFHKIAQELAPIESKFSTDMMLDERIFARVKKVYDGRKNEKLSVEQLMLLDKTYKGFVRNGVALGNAQKDELRKINEELSLLGAKFAENALKATNAFELHITDGEDLKGLPESALEAASETAKERGKDGYVITLQMPSYIPFLTYCENRVLREKVWRAASTRAGAGDFDNRPILKRIAVLRHQRAKLLGYPSHSSFVLELRMAKDPQAVFTFLERILQAAKPRALEELQELKDFARRHGLAGDLKPWDTAFYSEKLKQEKYQLDDEMLRPYFKLENVIDGVFEHARRLYGLKFVPRTDVPVYHPEVKAYEVRREATDEFVSLFYADFHPRATKRGGAWMTSFREQGLYDGKVQRPLIAIVCNFTKSTPTKPSLLSFDEVLTMFHEFGHALHGMLSMCQYRSVSGTNVYWDFVELPSQIFENWVYEKESLDLFAKHYETGELIPQEYIDRIRESARFQSAMACVRQVSLGTLDMAWHTQDVDTVADVEEFETKATAEAQLMPREPGTLTSTAFSHIFAGGYSSGYYSYKWAEVLDADAFEFFKERGIFNADVAKLFRENVLERGGTEDPMELYKKFRGREPDPKALLRRDGLV
ncbi:MAG TPA: M3 family metallopeptidase [Bdellovibrionota bacterium]|nr:M3 family metallopeptidase [Bdellovibrionota bacterium]